MADARDFILSYGWVLALCAAGMAMLAILVWRAHARRKRRDRRRVRNIARQRVWDWLMMRQNVRRLTHQPDEEQV